jgi:hypothetical protein
MLGAWVIKPPAAANSRNRRFSEKVRLVWELVLEVEAVTIGSEMQFDFLGQPAFKHRP